jgi:hypothetical protein
MQLVGVELPFTGVVSGPKGYEGAKVLNAHLAKLVDASTGNSYPSWPEVLMIQLELKDGTIVDVPERVLIGYVQKADSPA